LVVTIRLPTCRNDGSPVSEAELNDILAEAWKTFGGYTLKGPDRGAWVSDTGQLYEDESYALEIGMERSRYAEARVFAVQLGQQLQQEAMYFEVR
jgi:hypothetical protein